MDELTYYQLIIKNNNLFKQYVDKDGKIFDKNPIFKNIKEILDKGIDLPNILNLYIMSELRYNNTVTSIRLGEINRLFKPNPISSRELSRVDLEELYNYGARVYDPTYHENMKRILDTIVTIPSYNNKLNSKIRMWLKHITIIGKGVFGVASSVGINKIDGLFVIKFNMENNEDITHEYVIGSILNELRSINVINYVYCYGGFRCGQSPIVNKELPGFCNDGPLNIDHLVIENISNAQTFDTYLTISDLSTENYLSIFMQLCYALSVANNNYGFTHWDLHGSNILIKDNPKLLTYWASYKIDDTKTHYVKTNGLIPYIIDYGQASIRTSSGAYLGPLSRNIPERHYRAKPFLLMDIYKIILATLYTQSSIAARNPIIITFAKRCLVKLFKIPLKDLEEILTELNNNNTEKLRARFNYRLPPIENIANDYIRLLNTIYSIAKELKMPIDIVININRNSLTKENKILSCAESGCMISPKLYPEGYYNNYLDLCYSNNNLLNIEKKISEKITIDVYNEISDLIKKFNDKYKFLKSILDIFTPLVKLTKGDYKLLVNQIKSTYIIKDYNLWDLIIAIYYQGTKLWANINTINDIVDILTCIKLNDYDNNNYTKIYTILNNLYSDYKTLIIDFKTIKSIIKANLFATDYATSLNNNNNYKIFALNWDLYEYLIELPININ